MGTRVDHVLARLNRMDSSDCPNHPGLRVFFPAPPPRLKIDRITTIGEFSVCKPVITFTVLSTFLTISSSLRSLWVGQFMLSI